MTSDYGKINLKVNKNIEGRVIEAGAVARMRLTQSNSGKVDWKERRKTVAITVGDLALPESFELVPGKWSIDVDLPSGEILQDEFQVVAGEVSDLEMDAEPSARESLSWHHYSGSVQGRDGHQRATRLPRSTVLVGTGDSFPGLGNILETTAIPSSKTSLNDVADSLQKAVNDALARGEEVAKFSMSIFEQKYNQPQWQWLLDVSAGEPFSFNQKKYMKEISIEEKPADDIYVAFSIPNSAGENRRWAIVDGLGVRHLVSIPTPWENVAHGPFPELEILFHVLSDEHLGPQLVVKDDSIAAMLAFMNAGKLSNAALVVDRARVLLFHKITNRIAAAGGGYVMLATRLHSDDTEWQQWIFNLAEWFVDLPDGKILQGAMYLNGPKDVRDFDKAAACFKEAYARGIPYYSLGISWLRSGLATLQADYPELAEAAKNVGSISQMIEPKQPFTALKLPPETA
ncbi:MAG: hypothetical protein GY761_17905 [Hyphomicrobiales bacterium]|nr:hypothetical protein [Hyphomicrobiales bacterium]